MATSTTTRKKKRRPKLAPRYIHSGNPSDEENAEEKDAVNAQQSKLVREVFTSATCRCFVLKSFSEANFHKSLKFGIWSTTTLHNALLDQVFKSDLTAVRPVLFFFSVCGTKHFNGVARMTSGVRTDSQFQLWEKLKYEGFFHVEWLLVKDVPNYVFTGVKMSNTPTKKSITSCRDCEEVLFEEANEFLSIFTEFDSRSSAWDDFAHYDQLQEQLERKRGLLLSGGADRADMDSFLVPLQQEELSSI
ncbi:putative high-glucose-regulated protein [Phytophthora cinnamomi]|uniref:putative high-glucose-regulated protein n=1 Tax=Phytophthora cinnamomi TaxID=4785 RepID=UPI00355A995B|nr:putative high-glucose-regulated protein [Phytophthora cinnamomi]